MAIQAGTAYIPVKADMSQFGRQVQTGTKSAQGKIKGFAKTAGGLMAGAFAVAKVKDFFGSAIEGAREAMAIDRQTEAVIKSTGGVANVTAQGIDELAGRLQKTQSISDEVVQSGANMVLTFTNIRNEAGEGNDVFDQTVELAGDMSVALGQDMKSSSLQLGKALNDPIKGMSSLTRSGVSFTDQQKEQVKAMVESGDTLGAQKVILAELETQFGGSAAAQADASTKMKLSWADFSETVGRLVVPMVDRLLEVLTKVAAWAAENPAKLKAIAIVIGGALVLAFTAWAVSALAAAAATIAAALPVIALGVAIAALVAGIVYVWKNWRDIWAKIRDFVSDALGKVVDWVKALPGRAQSALSSTWSKLSVWWSDKFTAVKDYASDRVDDVVAFLNGLPKRARDALSSAWATFSSFWTEKYNAVKQFVSDRVDDIVDFFRKLPGRLIAGLRSAWSAWSVFASGLFTAVRDAVSDRVDDVVGYFTGMPGRLVDAVKDGASKLLSVGRWIVNQVLDGVKLVFSFSQWFSRLPSKIVGWVKDGFEKLVDLGETVVDKIVEGIKKVASSIGSAILNAIPGGGAISRAIGKIPGVGDGPGAPPGGGGTALKRVQGALGAGTYITSTYRTPAHNRRVGGSPTSYHTDRRNPAVDIGGSTRALDALAAKLRAMGGWREFLWRVKGHYDHIHVAHDGGHVTPFGMKPFNVGHDELLTKLQVGETVLPKDFEPSGGIDPEEFGERAARSYARTLQQLARAS